MVKQVTLGPVHQEAANTFLTAGALEKAYKKQREAAKKSLVDALGKASEGMLPDGRLVSKVITHFDEATFSRAAYDATTITVSTLSVDTVRDALKNLVGPAAKNLPRDRAKAKAKAAASGPPKARVGK